MIPESKMNKGMPMLRVAQQKVLLALGACVLLCGCVERTLSIKTAPDKAMVYLNDEEAGFTPVTVELKWYGDYRVRIQKEGYETLQTHRKLKAPWYDYFPFDFFAQLLTPQRIVDNYEWTFELESHQPLDRDSLIQKAQALQAALDDPNALTAEELGDRS
ncbi:PEGA domain-containing protein [Planctomycetota bacterium]